MAASPIPAKTEWLRAGETLAIASVGGIILNWLGFPAGLVTGSLLGVATAALFGRPVHIPVPLSRVISVVVGISLGAVVRPSPSRSFATERDTFFAVFCQEGFPPLRLECAGDDLAHFRRIFNN